jgi:hypothetical protein
MHGRLMRCAGTRGGVGGKHLGRLGWLARLGFDKLWPDAMPVIRAQVLPSNKPLCLLLDLNATFRRWLAPVVLVPPLADLIGVNRKLARKVRCGRSVREGKVFVQVHDPHYRSTRYVASRTFCYAHLPVAPAMFAA